MILPNHPGRWLHGDRDFYLVGSPVPAANGVAGAWRLYHDSSDSTWVNLKDLPAGGWLLVESTTAKFKSGDPVAKLTGDYKFYGRVISVMVKTSGAIRYAVENPDGILHIFSESQLSPFDA